MSAVPRRSSSFSAKRLEGWRASPTVDASDGAISDEYSDDDDPGYRIVLVEDVGELYPDLSYRMRNRAVDPTPTASSSQDVARSKQDADDDDDDEADDVDEPDEDDSAAEDGDASASDEEDELVQRLKNIDKEGDGEKLTRLPQRSPVHVHDGATDDPDSPPESEGILAVPAEPKLAWEDSESSSRGDHASASGDSKKHKHRNSKDPKAAEDAAKAEKKAACEDTGECEAGVDAEELAAHHMPDLIEGHQPMFNPAASASSTTSAAAAAPPVAVSATKPNGVEQASEDEVSRVDVASDAADTEAVESVSETVPCVKTASGAATPVPSKREAASDKAAAEPADETVYYDCFDLKIVYERNRTGFEETKDFPIEINGVIAGRYQILEFLGAAAFSKAVQCVDLTDGSYVCIKIIKNNKDFFDQSLDEIKILKYLNAHDTQDNHHLLQLYDYFYFKEHLFIVTELLRDNLYEFSKFNRESGAENYFTLPRLQKITRECLEGLKFVHDLRLIHCDLKPENILIRSYSRCEIKIIGDLLFVNNGCSADFGSSCFVTDHLTSYVQSRSYRAPEVILGLPYDELIDMWSLGCILAELWTGRVLFQNDSLATLLARVVGILGGIDEEMLLKGRYTHRFFTKHKILYDRLSDEDRSLVYIFPKRTSLQHRLASSDALFVEFVGKLLEVNPARRLSAAKALEHPWLSVKYPS